MNPPFETSQAQRPVSQVVQDHPVPALGLEAGENVAERNRNAFRGLISDVMIHVNEKKGHHTSYRRGKSVKLNHTTKSFRRTVRDVDRGQFDW